mgnify:CR=1 FL=1
MNHIDRTYVFTIQAETELTQEQVDEAIRIMLTTIQNMLDCQITLGHFSNPELRQKIADAISEYVARGGSEQVSFHSHLSK